MSHATARLLPLISGEVSASSHRLPSLFLDPLRRGLASKAHPTKSWKALSSKRGNKNFYKGRGAQHVGMHTSKGKYIVLPARRPNYILPSLKGTKVWKRWHELAVPVQAV